MWLILTKNSMKVKLVDVLSGEVAKHENKVTLNLFLQTWEVPSTPIQRNKAGMIFFF